MLYGMDLHIIFRRADKNSYMSKLRYASDAQVETLKYLTSFQKELARTIKELNNLF